MTSKEKALTASLLNLAANEFSNHGCNDVDETIFNGWTLEERQSLVKEFHTYNGDLEEYNPKFVHIPDYALMNFLATKLLE